MSATRMATVAVLPGVSPMPVVLRRPGQDPLVIIDGSDEQLVAVELYLGFPPREAAES